MIQDAFSYLTHWSNWTGPSGLLVDLGQQLLLSITALLVAVVIGLPIALWLGHLGKGGFLAINISNIGRAVPTFAVLVLLSVGPAGTGTVGPYGRASVATLISLTLFALPPIITNTYVGMREVDKDTLESARGMGMTGMQLFREVELPLATPLMLTGLRLALVQVWATATIAALVAGPGLGDVITLGFLRSDYGQALGGAIVVALVALVLEGGAALAERYLNPLARVRRRTNAGTSRRAKIAVA